MAYRYPAALGLAFALGLVGSACSTTTAVELETYGDEAAEDYGCIVGDLGCECAAGNKCDAGLTCMDGTCRCIEGECKNPGPMTTSSSDSSMDESDTDSGTDESESGETDPTEDSSTSEESTDTSNTTESTSDTTDDTTTDTTEETDTTDDTSTT
ncbi:MAG: hypothetical protein HC927_13840 [Deltaproteobacteria bacterium]|nr:hypothetical protein [Deltaproteobacteria bacterium]